MADQIARRDFLRRSAATAAVGAVAGTGVGAVIPSAASAATASDPRFVGKKRVAILGGGCGGLSAAHELLERGFTVDVYDRYDVAGGKCRSIPVDGTGTGGRA